jgi:VTC domain
MADTRETRAAACELKFVIDDRLAPRVKEWARTHLQPDPHGCGTFRDEYRISTLYFDTRRFDVFHRNDSFGRAKYRVRRYGDANFVFFERKLRKPGLLIKRRTRDDIDTLDRIADRIIDPDWAAHWFQGRLLVRSLRPVCRISYHRTARVAHTAEGPARLTLDSGLRAIPIDSPRFEADPGEEFLQGRLVLELKYHGRVPALFRRLIEEFALAPETASKYRLGMATTGDAGGPPYRQVHESADAAYA